MFSVSIIQSTEGIRKYALIHINNQPLCCNGWRSLPETYLQYCRLFWAYVAMSMAMYAQTRCWGSPCTFMRDGGGAHRSVWAVWGNSHRLVQWLLLMRGVSWSFWLFSVEFACSPCESVGFSGWMDTAQMSIVLIDLIPFLSGTSRNVSTPYSIKTWKCAKGFSKLVNGHLRLTHCLRADLSSLFLLTSGLWVFL